MPERRNVRRSGELDAAEDLRATRAGEATVNEPAEPCDMTLPAISKHIKDLENAGLVARSRRADSRPCTLGPAPLKAISSWAEQ